MKISNFKFQISNSERGITLVEIMVVVVMIAIIAGVLVANFPAIKLHLSLSRAVHIIVQDIKTAQNLSGSGHKERLSNGGFILPKGYGVYINTDVMGNKKYLVYADVNGNYQYDINKNQYESTIDYILKVVDLEAQEPGIIINEIHGANSRLSINFAPPNFDTTISDLMEEHDGVQIIIAIESDPSSIRTIYVNKAGLIETR